MKPRLVEILQHTIGANEYGEIPRGYDRNHFVTDEATADWPLCQELVALGMMEQRTPHVSAGGSPWFSATSAGKNAAIEHAKPRPKLTRSQERYQRYLSVGDLFENFRQFLQYDGRKQP